MSEMVGRVARAIEDCHDKDATSAYERIGHEVALECARAAIEAMRDLTGCEMIFMKGGNVPPSNRGRDHLGPRASTKRIGDLAAKEAWETMIDAALTD